MQEKRTLLSQHDHGRFISVVNEDDIHLADFTALSPPMQQQAVALIVDAFYQHRTDLTHEEALTKIGNALRDRKEIAFCIADAQKVLGISTYSLYDYQRMREQLYMETRYQESCLSSMRLASFHELLCRKSIHQGALPKVAGFGYSFVLPAFRNQGMARLLFRRRLEDICSHKDVGVIFAIVRGPYAQMNVSPLVMSSFLQAEQHVNGWECEQRVKVTGVWVECTHLDEMLRLPISSLSDHSGSPAMTKLIAQSGFVPLGFFRSLSPVWATTRAALELS